MSRILGSLAVCLALLATAPAASAQSPSAATAKCGLPVPPPTPTEVTRRFDWPQCSGGYLDGCGGVEGDRCKGLTPLGLEWCKLNGYPYLKAIPTSVLSPANGTTVYIEDSKVCGDINGFCYGPPEITCTMEPSLEFKYPTFEGLPLDWCTTNATEVNCGELTAAAYCKAYGYLAVADFEPAPIPSLRTKTLEGGEECEHSNGKPCFTFSSITCGTAVA